jgi:hypothetical protein
LPQLTDRLIGSHIERLDDCGDRPGSDRRWRQPVNSPFPDGAGTARIIERLDAFLLDPMLGPEVPGTLDHPWPRPPLHAGWPQDAANLATEQSATSPDDLDVLITTALAMTALGQHDSAVHHAGQVAVARPLEPTSHQLVALVASHANHAELALRAAHHAAGLAPDDWRATALLASIRIKHATRLWRDMEFRTQNLVTLETAERAVAQAPDRAEPLYVLCLAHILSGAPHRARRAHAKAVRMNPALARAGRKTSAVISMTKEGISVEEIPALLDGDRPGLAVQSFLRAFLVTAFGRAATAGMAAFLLLGIGAGWLFPDDRPSAIPGFLVGACALGSWLTVAWSARFLRGLVGRHALRLMAHSPLLILCCLVGLASQVAFMIAAFTAPAAPVDYASFIPMRVCLGLVYVPLMMLWLLLSSAVRWSLGRRIAGR